MPSTNLRAGASDYDYSAAWHLYIAGAGLGHISEVMKIPYSTLAAYANRHIWKETRQKALDHAKKALKENLAERVAKHKNNHMHFVLDQLETTQEHIDNMEIGNNKEAGQVPVSQKLAVIKQHDDIARRTLGLDEESNNNAVAQGFAFLIAARQQVNGANNALENAPSAMLPLLDDSEANLGILRSGNAHPIEPQEAEITSIEQVQPTTGPQDRKPLPKTIQFKAPTPLVNESEEQ